jgi:hypothetical protein
MHLARVEQEQAQVAGSQFGIVGQLPEEGKPVVAGGFPGDVQTVEAIGVQAVQQHLPGFLIAHASVGKGLMGEQRLAIRKEQADIRPLEAEVDPDL